MTLKPDPETQAVYIAGMVEGLCTLDNDNFQGSEANAITSMLWVLKHLTAQLANDLEAAQGQRTKAYFKALRAQQEMEEVQ